MRCGSPSNAQYLKSLPFSGAPAARATQARERVHGVMDTADLKRRARGHQYWPYAVVSGFLRGKTLHADHARDPPFTRRFRASLPKDFIFHPKRAAKAGGSSRFNTASVSGFRIRRFAFR